MLTRFILAVLLLLVPAGDILADAGKLLGSSIPMEAAITKADAIFAGKLISLAPPVDQSVSGMLVGRVKFLSGTRQGISSPMWTQDGGMMGALNIQDDGVRVFIPATTAAGEVAAQVGDLYIFWVTGDARQGMWAFPAFKIYPSTPENNSAVRHLIKQMGKR
jgi:hypothetical protein